MKRLLLVGLLVFAFAPSAMAQTSPTNEKIVLKKKFLGGYKYQVGSDKPKPVCSPMASGVCWSSQSDEGKSGFYRETSPEKKSYLELGMGLVHSSGYGNALQDAYGDRYKISGANLGIALEGGVGFKIQDQAYLTPRLRLLAYRVEFANSYGLPGSSKASIAFLPGVSGRYIFGSNKGPFYASGDLGIARWASDLDDLEVKVDGYWLSAAVGYLLGKEKEYELELGYLWVPFKTQSYSLWNDASGSQNASMGGLNLLFRRRFGI